MIGILDTDIIASFQEAFEHNCLSLFGDAYLHISKTMNITIDWEEENISANFLNYIDHSERAIGLNINISDEHRLYNASILSGSIKAKSASRIDFKLTTNWTQNLKRLDYFIEAKNLIEFDCPKRGRKTKLIAKENHKRYIETGINNFITKTYPQNGCLTGYVLQGDIGRIVKKINVYLNYLKRDSEQLVNIKSNIPSLPYFYISSHASGLILKHFFLDFYDQN
jgi:hypothetical protein